MSEPRKRPASPARHCDDILDLIDAVLATGVIDDRASPAPQLLAAAGSR